MATRFYLPATGTAPVTGTIQGGWEQTAGFTVFPTDITKSGTAHNAGAPRAKGSTVANNDRLDRFYVSAQQLAAQTIPVGTFSAVLRTIQSAATTDAWLQIMIYVVSGDGATLRGTLYDGSTATAESATAGNEAQEYATASQTRIKSALATASVVASAGDRIQIEIGARINGTTSADTFTHRYGDDTAIADFALTAGLTTDLVPWVELSPTLTWASASQTSGGDATGSGTLSVGTLIAVYSGGLSGSGTLSQTNTPKVTSAGGAASAGTLGALNTPLATKTGALSGSGTLTASAGSLQVSTGPATGSGTLTAVAVPKLTRTAGTSGSGTLAQTVGNDFNVALGSEGELTGDGLPKLTRTGALTSTGTLTAQAVPLRTVTAAPSGSGTLTASIALVVAFSGTGSTLIASVKLTLPAPLSGSGQLTAFTDRDVIQPAPTSGSGVLTAQKARLVSVTAVSTRTLSATYSTRLLAISVEDS